MTFSQNQELFILVVVFVSIFGVIGIYNLCLYFVIRRRVLLDYCVFVFALMSYISVPIASFLELGLDIEGFSISTAAFSTFGGLLFTRSFLGIEKTNFTRLYQFYWTFMLLALAVILVQTLKPLLPVDWRINYFSSYFAALLALATVLLILFSSLYLWNKKDSAKMYVYTCIPMTLGICFFVVVWLISTPVEGEGRTGIYMVAICVLLGSTTLQMILYSTIVGYNLKKLETEKLELQKDINQKLKQEVDRQTQSLTLANEQIEEQKNALEASNQMKNKLFSLVSHDLRGPLNSLANLVGLLDHEAITTQEFGKFSKDIKKNIKESVLVLDRILQWSHAQLDEVKINKVAFALSEVVDENIALFQDQLSQKELEVNEQLTGNDV